MSLVADMESLLEQSRLLVEYSQQLLEQSRENKAAAQILANDTRALAQRSRFLLQSSLQRHAAHGQHVH